MKRLFNKLDMLRAFLSTEYTVTVKDWRVAVPKPRIPEGALSVVLRVHDNEHTFGVDIHGYVVEGPVLVASGRWDPKSIWFINHVHFKSKPFV